MTKVAMIIPSRGRPRSVLRQAEAWRDTKVIGQADLLWAIDADDPAGHQRYVELAEEHDWMKFAIMPEWMPMVPKLNMVAQNAALNYDVVGFMGDDHLPRTTGWVAALAAAHILHGPGIYYGRDGFQDINLPTWWAMSSAVIKALGRMVPADVEHMYCDNSILQLGKAARCLRFLPSVMIEHMHPVARKAEMDEGYRQVNSPEQYARDKAAFLAWMDGERHVHGTLLRGLARGV